MASHAHATGPDGASSEPWRLSRRALLGAGAALPAALWLASCGGDDAGSAGAAGSKTGTPPKGSTIVPRYPPDVIVPGTVRLPLSFEQDGVLLADGPDAIAARVTADGGSVVADGLTAARIQLASNQTAFWVVRADVPATGTYWLDVDGVDEPQAFVVSDPAGVPQPKPGEPLPPFDTPTIDDPRGVEPICTRAEGVCSLHTITLTEALTLGTPVAYLISTPAHCQFGVCGPVLEVLLAAHEEYGDRVAMVHADVYADDTATTVAPAVAAYSMTWEPSLFVTDASGTIVDRLDISFGPEELRETLRRAGA